MTPEQMALRDRVLKLEMQQAWLGEKLDETLEALHKSNHSLMALQRTLDAFTNKGVGGVLVIRALLALGGLGWLAGLAAFIQQFLNHR